jgi:exodeoxyribonuclease V beta subunit
MVQDALLDVGVPSVIGNTGSVFETAEACHLLDLLEAIATNDQGAARRVLASPLFGWSAAQLEDAYGTDDSPDWNDWIDHRGQWRQLIDEHGVMRAFRSVLDEYGVAQTLLQRKGGQRRLTNVIHLVELLNVVEKTERLGPTGLARWLEGQIVTPTEEDEARLVRLETDALAVQISTIHKAKGLEYPVVFVPYLMAPVGMRGYERDTLVIQDPDDVTRHIVNVAIWKHTPAKKELGPLRDDELRREAARVLYVAITRARHRCVVYAGAVLKAETSALTVLLHGDEGPDLYQTGQTFYENAEAVAVYEDISWRLAAPIAEGLVGLSRCGRPEGTAWEDGEHDARPLVAREYHRGPFDLRWGLASYSALTKDTGNHGGRGAEPTIEDGFEPIGFDADDHGAVEAEPTTTAGDEVVFAAFPSGTQPGTFVHEVFERMDFGWLAPSEPGMESFRALLTDLLPTHGFDAHAEWVEGSLVPGMVGALQTPLGGPMGGRFLSIVPRAHRLDELTFDFAVAGGRSFRPGMKTVSGKHLVRALADRRGDGIVRTDYVNALSGQRLAGRGITGFMTGSIDLVFRADTDDGPKWFIADYKSNLLRDRETYRCVPEAYRSDSLRAAMEDHHYFIQYHLYTLALHRYLSWRLGAGYDYERDFGGAYYLFIRGMTGATAPQGQGVFFDKPPLRTIQTLDLTFRDPAALEANP